MHLNRILWRARLLQILIVAAILSRTMPESLAQDANTASLETADVVIYGGTSAGVAAAVQVSRMGHSVVLIEPGKHIGGLTSGGLGFTDSGDKRVIGGIAREFYQRIHKHYDTPAAWVYEKSIDYNRYRSSEDAMWTFEPKVAESLFHEMLLEAKVLLIMGERLDRTSGVESDRGQIISITTESGRIFRGKQFIDATYEGDLMAAAKVRYTVGREANSQYAETLNGNQPNGNTHNHRFVRNVDPYVEPGNPASGLLPGIEATGAGEEGVGDHRVQAYCFRMCMSNAAENRIPFPRPENYDESRYELLFRNFEAGDLRFPMKPDMMPNGKTDTNNNCAFSTDYIGGNYAYVENLPAPVCLSSTHIAYGSIRMEPVFMVHGQSAATAAVLALESDVELQALTFATLRERLLKDGQVLDLPPNV